MRRQRFFVQFASHPAREIEALVAKIKQLIADHPLTHGTNFHVRFNDLGESI